MTSSAQVGDRYVGGPTRNLIRCPGCWQLCFRDAFGRVHVNSAASQYVGTQRLHRFVAIDDEHVFRAHLKGNRRLLGHRTPPGLLEAGVSESITFEKRA